MVTVTKNGTALAFYVNGSAAGTCTMSSDPAFTSITQYIGGDTGGAAFYGCIDEVGYWNRVLTAAEIAQLYNGGIGLSYPFYQGTLYIWTGSVWSPVPMKDYDPSSFVNRPVYMCQASGIWELVQSF
jgi:Concanavalin A-like lectin/glucanases superfamily